MGTGSRSGVVQLTNNEATDRWPVWSPGGGRVLFDSNRDGGFEIFVMNADGSGLLQLTDDEFGWDGGHARQSPSRDTASTAWSIRPADSNRLNRIGLRP